MAEDNASKTEEPTQRKLDRGREEGQVVSSQELKSWAMLLTATLATVTLAPGILRDLGAIGRTYIAEAHAIALDPLHFREAMADLAIALAISVGPLLGAFLLVGLFASLVQTGLVYSPKKIAPKLEKISLASGAKRLFSMRALVEFVKGILKIGVVAAVSYVVAIPILADLKLMPAQEVLHLLWHMRDETVALLAGTVAVMTVVAALDYFYQRYEFLKQMRMTRPEVRDEHKQAEGDPMVKGRIRRLRMERARKRMMAAVPKADVVITNPTHYAVALEYKMEAMRAPKLVAKGVDSLARKIREVAEEHDVTVIENPPLARALYATVELDEEIPQEHYKAVAEVIGYVMRLKGKLPRR